MPQSPSSVRGRVLVIDDDPQVRRTVGRLLARDHDVEGAASATEALAKLVAGNDYDVLFCDLTMPHMDGVALAKAIRGIAPDQAARVVFLTGADPAECEKLGAPFVTKPFTADLLRSVVQGVLARAA